MADQFPETGDAQSPTAVQSPPAGYQQIAVPPWNTTMGTPQPVQEPPSSFETVQLAPNRPMPLMSVRFDRPPDELPPFNDSGIVSGSIGVGVPVVNANGSFGQPTMHNIGAVVSRAIVTGASVSIDKDTVDGVVEHASAEETEESAEKGPTELVLPKALEDVLALKDQRAAEFHVNADDFTTTVGGVGGLIGNEYGDVGEDSDDDAEVRTNGAMPGAKSVRQSKAEKNKKKKRRKKENRKMRHQREQDRIQVGQLAADNEEEQASGTTASDDRGEEATRENGDASKFDQDTAGNAEEAEEVVRKKDEEDKSAEGEKDTKGKSKDKTSSSSSRRKESSRRHKDSKEKSKEEEVVSTPAETVPDEAAAEGVTIEYVPEKITIADLAPMYRQFYRVFEIFKLDTAKAKTAADKDRGAGGEAVEAAGVGAALKKAVDKLLEDDDDDDDDGIGGKDDKERLSKRKLKKLTRLSVAELKQLVARPDVVEMHDVTARDPKLLVQLKAYRNTVQVPRHWCFKRKYLQGKRGIEKPPFDLPAFIKKTGIMEMRESLQEKDDAKSLKSKMRDRVRPKMGKIDIDYQKLHDAFFKWQTKPRMTIHGDLYYEGKEFETRLKEKKPGDLSEELRIALGMPVGPNSHKIPPPWLIAQQRYGPPPSYPNLKIPGLNAPIPEGTSFGYHAGGWGKPPVDENGKPLYGDVFGTSLVDLENGIEEGDIERNQWGELESESEESSEEEDDEGEDMTQQVDESGLVTPAEGLVTPSGLTSGVPAGMETPETIELRKKKIEAEMEDNETPVLYQVLPEKRTDRVGASMMGSTHVYDISGVSKPPPPPSATRTAGEGTVELALDPSELDMDNDAMAQRYEQQMREQQSHLQKEDLSDMLAEHVARQKSKRKRQTDPAKATKKYKEFKF